MLINNPKILIADDGEEFTRDLLKEFLGLKGIQQVKISYSALNAISIMKYFIPDIVITEIFLDRTGLEVVQEAKGLNPSIKVIFITSPFSYAKIEENLDEIKKLCPCAWLKKPFTCRQLYYYILGAMGKYKEASEIIKECHEYERS